jgi:cytoskeletal protein CcmA (bactofilin family)
LFKRRKPEDEAEPAGAGTAPSAAKPATPAAAVDSGLGVPPFRPATPPPENQAKETPMARPPFGSSTPNPPMPAPNAPRPPAPQPLRSLTGRDSAPGAERRTLVVGRGISLSGLVQDAERLVVEGTVEAQMIHAAELAVSLGGIFKGEIEVEDAEVAGTVDGTVIARGALIVRASGVVLGTARCRRLQVEDGGQITGRIEMLSEPSRARPAEPPRVAEVSMPK